MNVRFSRFVAIVLVLVFAPIPWSRADTPTRLAVLEFEVASGIKIDRVLFSDLARSAVNRRSPQLFVMTRESTEALLQANGKTMADCVGECEVEVGRKLGADFIISGRITRAGSLLFLTIRLIGTSDGRLLASADARGKSTDELIEKTDAALTRIVAPLGKDVQVRFSNSPQVQDRGDAPPPSKGRTREPKTGLIFLDIPSGRFAFPSAVVTSTALLGQPLRVDHPSNPNIIEVNAFKLGETAVTMLAYAKCVTAGACKSPSIGGDCNWNTAREDHPINCVDWNQAVAFCRWIGGRLPKPEEREYVAAGGGDGRIYPWGNDAPGSRACWNGEGNDLGKGERHTTCSVGAYKAGDSSWGLHDLAGNVSEWVDNDVDGWRETRGGNWGDEFAELLLSAFLTRGPPESPGSGHIGFRCAL